MSPTMITLSVLAALWQAGTPTPKPRPDERPAPSRPAPSGSEEQSPEDEDEVPPELSPEQIEARGLFGQALDAMEKKHTDRVSELCEAAARLDPGYDRPLMLRARVAFEARSYRVAELWYTRALNLRPHDPDLLMVVAQCHLELDEAGAAESLLDIASAHGVEGPELQRLRVRVLMDTERWSEAEELLRSLRVGANPDPELASMLLDLYEETQRYDDALPLAHALSQQKPMDRSLRYRYCHLLLASERWEAASLHMEATLQRDPADQGLRRALISLYTGPYPNPERRAHHVAVQDQREKNRAEEEGDEARTGSPDRDDQGASSGREEDQS